MSIKIKADRYILAYQTVKASNTSHLTITHLENCVTWILSRHLYQVFGYFPGQSVSLAHTFALANLLNQNSC